ncbi:hypothetical protein RJ55_00150 [Drechmeria coniospora]|nr:hypothetical protein RJ55_00150 [Drechmeria coniospora]
MLALQQPPRMGSKQPEDPFLPFGYAVDETQQSLFNAPDPAPGAPLLSEDDSKFLSSFFEDMTANHYNMPSFGEGLHFSDAWLDLPPQFMGSATFFGTPTGLPDFEPDPAHAPSANADRPDLPGILPGSHLMPPPPPPPPQSQPFPQQHSDDVLNAAATLLQNGAHSRGGIPIGGAVDSSQPRRVGYPVGHLRHQPLEEFKEENRRSSLAPELDSTLTHWMWGPQGRPLQRKSVLPDIQWGSDASFGPSQGYVPEANKETAEAGLQRHMKCLDCLEPTKGVVDSRPSSPTNGHSDNGDGCLQAAQEDDPSAPPRKRRKSRNVKEQDDDDDDDDASSKSGRKRKPVADRNGTSPPSDATSGGRRRKSTAGGPKPPRENLSEEQKRENHIRSEQKRRTLIKEGFDDLGELVPGLNGGGFSKSTTLTMAAEWLEEIIRGNKILAAQVAALTGN